MRLLKKISLLLCLVSLLSSCRFTLEESDYIGHYEGTYRLANFTPYEGTAVLDITSAGNNKCNLMFCPTGLDSVFFYNWEVDRYSGGLYGPSALIHWPGTDIYDYNEVFISKTDNHATLYLRPNGTNTLEVNFSGDRIE